MQYKIGVGVTTTPKRKLSENFHKWTSQETIFHVNVDKTQQGVSHSRNDCIKYLLEQGCNIIILMDDDCYPVMNGYEQYFLDVHLKTGIHHFTLPESFKTQLIDYDLDKDLAIYNGSIGCFRFMTKELIDEVGYFNTKYYKYGFEDSAYTKRVMKSKLFIGREGEYPCPIKGPFYIHSEDVYVENPTPNYSYEEKQEFIRKNRQIYIEEITSNQIYYPYA